MIDQALPRATVPGHRIDLLTAAGRLPWLYAVMALGMLFLFLPLVMVVLFSFNVDETTRFPIRQLTLEWYRKLLDDQTLLDAFRNSVYVGIGTMLLSALLGVPAAFAFTRYRFRGQGGLGIFFTLPLTVPVLVLAIALLTLYSTLAIPLSLGTVMIGHTVYCVPLVFLVVRARLQDMDRSIEEAARDLGASGWRAFWKVTFPLIRSSIAGAMILAFAQSFDMFVITLFTIGPQSTLPLVVWSMLRHGISPTINALSTLMLMGTTIMLIVASKFTKITVET